MQWRFGTRVLALIGCALMALAPIHAMAATYHLGFVSAPSDCATFPTALQVGVFDSSGNPVVPAKPVKITLTAPGTSSRVSTNNAGIATFVNVGRSTAAGSQSLKATAWGYQAAALTLLAGQSTAPPAQIKFQNVGGTLGAAGQSFIVNVSERDSTGACLAPSTFVWPSLTLSVPSGASAALEYGTVASTYGAFNVDVSAPGNGFAFNAKTQLISQKSAAFAIGSYLASSLAKVGGDFGMAFHGNTVPVSVLATNSSGTAIPGLQVTFKSSVGTSGSVTVSTNNAGIASVNMLSPTTPSTFSITATATDSGQPLAPATFSVSSVKVDHYASGGSGTFQLDCTNYPIGNSLIVLWATAYAANGMTLAGVPLTWSTTGDSISPDLSGWGGSYVTKIVTMTNFIGGSSVNINGAAPGGYAESAIDPDGNGATFSDTFAAADGC